MTLIPIISILLGVAFILFLGLFIFDRKLLVLAVPLVGLLWFLGSAQLPNYVGYAVSEDFVAGLEAPVLSVSEDENWIYVLIELPGQEARLVKVANTPGNEDAAKKIKEQLVNGPSFIKFGASNLKDGKEGDATDSSIQTMDISDYNNGKYKKDRM